MLIQRIHRVTKLRLEVTRERLEQVRPLIHPVRIILARNNRIHAQRLLITIDKQHRTLRKNKTRRLPQVVAVQPVIRRIRTQRGAVNRINPIQRISPTHTHRVRVAVDRQRHINVRDNRIFDGLQILRKAH